MFHDHTENDFRTIWMFILKMLGIVKQIFMRSEDLYGRFEHFRTGIYKFCACLSNFRPVRWFFGPVRLFLDQFKDFLGRFKYFRCGLLSIRIALCLSNHWAGQKIAWDCSGNNFCTVSKTIGPVVEFSGQFIEYFETFYRIFVRL